MLTAIYSTYILLYADEVLADPFIMLHSGNLLLTAVTFLICHHLFSSYYHLYEKAWEYASVGELIAIIKSVTFTTASTGIILLILTGSMFTRVLIIVGIFHLMFIGGSRFVWRMNRDLLLGQDNLSKRALIIGAGSAGTMLVKHLLSTKETDILPVVFLDDDLNKSYLHIHGIKVVGDTKKIVETVKKFEINKIIIAIPSLGKPDLNRIFEECSKANIKTVIMPKIEDIMLGKLSSSQLRDVQVEDLLGREPVELDMKKVSKVISGKTVLVTGAGGSIGSEICRQVSKLGPSKLLLLGHGENSIYQIEMEIRNLNKNILDVVPIIADVQDRSRIFEIIEEHRPDVIYHAAAHKHVPLMEYNPKEAIKNNVIGTKNVADAADRFGVRNFVLISTDKAVNPTNVMGSTKRIAEMIIQTLSKKSQTKFAAVRFGNVLGSRGSVIPLFKKQIQEGGPVTVTHPDMTRYFMTIPEASRLVLQAGALAKGGEIFVLDMGQPVRIVDLANNLIKLSGLDSKKIEIKFSGLRPGEKMYEELLNKEEIQEGAVFPKIFIGKTVEFDYDDVEQIIRDYQILSDERVKEFVITFANKKEESVKKLVEL